MCGLLLAGMPFGNVRRLVGVVMLYDVIDAECYRRLQEMDGTAGRTDRIIIPDQGLLMRNLMNLIINSACVLPNDEYPETHTHKNQNKNIQRCRV